MPSRGVVPAPAGVLITAFGIVAAITMVTAYGLEARGRIWIMIFAGGCAATALYGVLIGAWIFAVLESVWAVIALVRFRHLRARRV